MKKPMNPWCRLFVWKHSSDQRTFHLRDDRNYDPDDHAGGICSDKSKKNNERAGSLVLFSANYPSAFI